jgi:hypothetical protein
MLNKHLCKSKKISMQHNNNSTTKGMEEQVMGSDSQLHMEMAKHM